MWTSPSEYFKAMEDLISKVADLLKGEFPQAELDLDAWKGSDRVSGSLTWKGFLGKDQVKRQRRVWKVLDANLEPQERARIAAIFTFTPAEMAVMREDTEE